MNYIRKSQDEDSFNHIKNSYMNSDFTESQKLFNDVAKQRHLNLDNLVLTTLLLCDNANTQPLPDKKYY